MTKTFTNYYVGMSFIIVMTFIETFWFSNWIISFLPVLLEWPFVCPTAATTSSLTRQRNLLFGQRGSQLSMCHLDCQEFNRTVRCYCFVYVTKYGVKIKCVLCVCNCDTYYVRSKRVCISSHMRIWNSLKTFIIYV